MTSYQRLAFSAVLFLLLSLPMFGQYVGTANPSTYDNLTYCATSACFNRMGTITGFTFLTASEDGVVVGGYLGKVYEWQPGSGQNWLEIPGWETVPNGSQIRTIRFSQQPSATTGIPYAVGLTNESSNNVYELVFNGTRTVWQSLPGNGDCATDVGITYNGDIWCLAGAYSGSKSIFHWSAGTWTQVGGALDNLSVNGSDLHTFACGVNAGNQLFVYSKSGTWVQLTGLGFTPSAATGAISCGDIEGTDGANGTITQSFTVLDTSGGVHMSRDFGQTWNTVDGSASVVTGPEADQTYVLGAGVPFHYGGVMSAVTETTSGTYTCPGCTGEQINHYAVANATFPHGLGTGTQQSEYFPWQDAANVTSHRDYDPSCDPVFTFGNPECNVALTSTVDCPVAGYLPVTYQTTEPMESGYTFQKYSVVIFTGKSVELPGVDLTYVQLTVVPWCTNTPYPVVNYIWVDEDDDAYYYYVIAHWRGYPGNWNVTWTINTGTSNTTRFAGCTSLAKAN